ncbi:hypothetical protein [Nitratifractor salsuginis]|uniref:Uncharacterized protein n=1 Tax=Nitratifractor salsuginis (strain DSM 16511 / JCM 12458 / E9I37-1) TaxID=749222 RepID=E6WY44_NITSE|nr:hypothetical protein [Nitratifractor salsuginis]ADV46418.1 hypothetical protein Nitsa_1165 [Nitratifractor salsuginis DSM 16511]
MGRHVNYGDYRWEWDPDNHTITITPKHIDRAGSTGKFGLGNAVIDLNIAHPETKLTQPITGETTSDGLIPPDFSHIRRWHAYPTQMASVTKELTGYNGWKHEMTYMEASACRVVEVSASTVREEGYSCKRAGGWYRLDNGGLAQGGVFYPVSVGGSVGAADQVVKVGEDIFLLSGGAVKWCRRSLISETGLSSPSTISGTMLNLIEREKGGMLPQDFEILEIAGGGTLKARCSDGVAYIFSVENPSRPAIVGRVDNAGRVTSHGIYVYDSIGKYYRTGGGTAPLAPYLEGEVVMVKEGAHSDAIIRKDDVAGASSPIADKISDVIVTGTPGAYAVRGTQVDAYGVIVQKRDALGEIRVWKSGSPVTPSDILPPSQADYFANNRQDWKTEWAGAGKTGNVVGEPDTWYSLLTAPHSSERDISMLVVSRGGKLYDASDSTWKELETTTEKGADLISYIYAHDMSNVYAIDPGALTDIEPFDVDGLIFTYSDNRWVDVDLNQH